MTRQQFLRTLSAGAIGFVARQTQAQPAAPLTFTYKTAGCEIRADVYGASEGAAKPALTWMHGGALILGNRKGIMRPFHSALLEQGYVIVSIGYRLAPETPLSEGPSAMSLSTKLQQIRTSAFETFLNKNGHLR